MDKITFETPDLVAGNIEKIAALFPNCITEAFGIPVYLTYPNDGKFGELVLGVAGPGVNVYVPEEMLEDAKAILSGEGVEEE